MARPIANKKEKTPKLKRGVFLVLLAVLGGAGYFKWDAKAVATLNADSAAKKDEAADSQSEMSSSSSSSQATQNLRRETNNNLPPVISEPQSTSAAAAAAAALVSPLLTDQVTDPWQRELFGRMDRVREKCGGLCSITDIATYAAKGSHLPGNSYSTFTTPVDCKKLFEMEEIDAGDVTVPYPIPEPLKQFYSLNGVIEIEDWRKLEQIYLGGEALINKWTNEDVERDKGLLGQGTLEGTYGKEETTLARNQLTSFIQRHGDFLQGKSVLVVGSSKPWFETLALWAGATQVTTLEYGAIVSEHPQITTLTPALFRQQYLEGKLPKYDVVMSYSSLEHSGLGRYGDGLNPWGDILSLARCWCATEDDAMLMIAVPAGKDRVQFNAHRIYGNIRYPLLTTNWVPADGVTDFAATNLGQPIRFFKKVAAPSQ